MRKSIRQIRQEAAQMREHIADMEATQLRIADRFGWNDPMIEEIERDITRIAAARRALLATITTAA